MMSDVTTTTFAMLMFEVIVFIFVKLLPAFVELKRPRDTGQELILDDVSILKFTGDLLHLRE
jgi:hypothetical protein